MRFKHYIIPSQKLGHRAHLLKPNFLAYYSTFLFALIICSNILVYKFPSVLGYATNINVNDLLSYTNKERESKGLSPLKLNNELTEAANKKAADMYKENYWAHISPKGKEPWDFIISSGYDYFYAGENLAVDFNDSKSVVKAWIDSPSHRDNLLNKNYTEIGFAVVDGTLLGRKTTLVVQMFGSPRHNNQQANARAVASAQTSKPQQNVVEEKKESYNIPENAPITENLRPVEELFNKDNAISKPSVLNTNTVFSMSKSISLIIGLFLTALFVIDWYYVRKLSLMRLTGHTFLHLLILILLLLGIWYSNVGLIL